MKILFDECLPRKLKYELAEHEVRTVPEMGWAGKKNGELLRLMTGQFDVFITVDSNLSYQQPLSEISVAFVILVAVNNKLVTLRPLMAQVLAVIETIRGGEVTKITTNA